MTETVTIKAERFRIERRENGWWHLAARGPADQFIGCADFADFKDAVAAVARLAESEHRVPVDPPTLWVRGTGEVDWATWAGLEDPSARGTIRLRGAE